MTDSQKQGLTTPKDRSWQKRGSTFQEIYLHSCQKTKNTLHQCCLCLLCSPDCSSYRCTNKSHYVCAQCACDWEADRLCPVCKNSSIASNRKSLSFSRMLTCQIQEQHSPFYAVFGTHREEIQGLPSKTKTVREARGQ